MNQFKYDATALRTALQPMLEDFALGRVSDSAQLHLGLVEGPDGKTYHVVLRFDRMSDEFRAATEGTDYAP